jgi:hypothetical protein
MHEIQNQRRALLAALVALAIFTHGVASDILLPLGPETPLTRLTRFVLTGGLLYSLIVLAPLWLYDKVVWRWINPQFDLSGTWEVTLHDLRELNSKHVTAVGSAMVKPYQDMLLNNSGQALIRQTPFRVWVQEATGFSEVTPDAVQTWSAEIVGVNLPGKLSVVFESSGNGGDFSGRDALVVQRRDWRGRPIEMRGDAFHVVKHLDIVIKGAILYRRVTRRSTEPQLARTTASANPQPAPISLAG